MTVAPPSLAPPEGSIGMLLAVLGRVSTRRFTDALRPLGLKPRHLAALGELRDGPLTQQALGERIGSDPTKLVGLLNELERWAFVVRRRDPDDRRRHIVEISDCGRERLAVVDRLIAGTEEQMLAGLTGEQRRQLLGLLGRLAAAGRVSATCPAVAAVSDGDEECDA